MNDYEYGLESCVYLDFKTETSELEALIERSRDLIRHTEKLLSSTTKQLEEEKSNSVPAAKRLNRKGK